MGRYLKGSVDFETGREKVKVRCGLEKDTDRLQGKAALCTEICACWEPDANLDQWALKHW